MTYRLEKEPNGKKAIIIDGWEKGMAPDPYSGINRLFSANLNTPGEVSVGYPITTSTLSGGGQSLGVPIARSTRLFSYGSAGVPVGSPQSFAILDANGRVWESTSFAGTWTFLSSSNSVSGSSPLDGISYWLGYLFKTRGANIDYWNGSTWSTAWKTTLSGGFKHYMYVGSDNVLYITNGNYLASITAPTPTAFDPTNTSTYALSVTKLQLPVNDVALSIAEVGGGNTPQSTLLVGGVLNAIYPWDKVSSSFSLPIYVADSYIGLMISANQNAFIFPGNQGGRGRIYITNGSQANEYFKMPDYVFNVQDPYFAWGDAIFHRNQLIFGCFVNSNAVAVQLFSQIWAIDMETMAFRSLSSVSTATAEANATALISTLGLAVSGYGFIVGWNDNGSAPGIGYAGTTSGIGTADIYTDIIPIGTYLQKETLTGIEFKLRSPLQSGESISITPISDGVFGTALTFSPTPTTGSISGYAPTTIQSSQWLQFSISLTGNSATSGVRLKELRLRLT